jgi:hypothetical protein
MFATAPQTGPTYTSQDQTPGESSDHPRGVGSPGTGTHGRPGASLGLCRFLDGGGPSAELLFDIKLGLDSGR